MHLKISTKAYKKLRRTTHKGYWLNPDWFNWRHLATSLIYPVYYILYLRILLCILLATSSECKTNLFKDIAEYVYNLFTLGLDVGDRLESNEQLEKVQESLNKLEEAMNRVQSMIRWMIWMT